MVAEMEFNQIPFAHADEFSRHLAAEGPEEMLHAVGQPPHDLAHLHLHDHLRGMLPAVLPAVGTAAAGRSLLGAMGFGAAAAMRRGSR
jgi:hypothetical protein